MIGIATINPINKKALFFMVCQIMMFIVKTAACEEAADPHVFDSLFFICKSTKKNYAHKKTDIFISLF